MSQIKNYIGFLTDHSSSMSDLRSAALNDYNANIKAIRDAASANMLDTIVSVFGFGGMSQVTRLVVNSNPHVLNPMTSWQANGNTPLYDAIGDMIAMFKALPDYSSPNVSFLVMATTDGEEYQSQRFSKQGIATLIKELAKDERWTFVFRIPKGQRHTLEGLNIPADNIQEWDTTTKGLEVSTAATTQAINSYYTSRSQGLRGSNVFYAGTANVTTQQVKASLVDISSEITVWPVFPEDVNAPNGKIEIKPFCEKRLGASPYLKGAAFYQLSKTEPVVQGDKLIIIRDKTTARVYEGDAARDMIGLPRGQNARVKAGDFGSFDIFIQSKSINRHLVVGTQVLYWAKIGEGFKPSDFPWLNKAQNGQAQHLNTAAQSAIQATTGISSPVVKPVATNTAANSSQFYPTRAAARAAARGTGKSQKDAGKGAGRQRWYIA